MKSGGSNNKNLEAILKAREARAFYQQELVNEYKKTLIAFKLNIPGPEKDNELYRKIFNNGMNLLEVSLKEKDIPIVFKDLKLNIAGAEAFIVVDDDPVYIKKICTDIEDGDMLGRIYDFDVIGPLGDKVGGSEIGRNQRRCFLCDEYVWVCSRARAHSLDEMLQFIENSAKAYFK